MPNFSKQFLSNSTNGRAIQITQTGFNPLITGTVLHSGVFGTSSMDEVYLYANNQSSADATLLIQWGAVTTGDSVFTIVPYQAGRVLISDGRLINNGLFIYGLVSGTNNIASSGISIDGYVNRIG